MTESTDASTPRRVTSEPPAPTVSAKQGARVVIIGGGLAGIAAAAVLARRSLSVTLIEARRRLGGRAGSFRDANGQQDVDYCQHVAMGCCTSFWHLMETEGLAAQFERVRELPFLSLDGRSSRFAASRWLPAPLHFLPAFSRLQFLSRGQRNEVRRGIWRLMRTASESVSSRVRFGDWLRDHGQSEATIDRFWDVVIVSALGESTARVAYAPGRKVFIDGFLSHRRAAELLVPRLPLSQLFGGQLAESLRAVGVNIRTSTAASQLLVDRQRVTGVQTRDGEVVPADYVVLAVPWHGAARLVPPMALRVAKSSRRGDSGSRAAERSAAALRSLQAVSRFPASPISGVHLWFDRRITDLKQAVLVGGLSQWMFQPIWSSDTDAVLRSKPGSLPSTGRTADGEGPGHYYQVVVSASREVQRLGQESTVAKIVEELAAVFPEAQQAKLLRWRVVTDPRAVFSVQPQTERQRPAQKTNHPGIFLAGDYTRTDWPATMEGAVISGYRAADGILQSLQRPGFILPSPLPPSWLTRRLIRRATAD